ncbi:MAG: hypothetical protein RJB55_2361, partial [Verrucomicrobiota bacterium]
EVKGRAGASVEDRFRIEGVRDRSAFLLANYPDGTRVGAVLRPGKLSAERTLTAFDAIMEAGGFDLTRADTRSVRIIRQEEGRAVTYTFNAKAILDGRAGTPFHLQPYDTIFVPERFTWF